MLEHSLELTSQELLEANAGLSSINTDLEMRVAARTAELSSSEARFRGLFEHVPVSIWEEDFSAVRQYINDLRGMGVVDFPAYFDEHPEAVAECARQVKIVDVNRATLEMYQAESKAQLLADLSKVLGPESLIPFKEELLALVRGDLIFEMEIINYTLRGERRIAFLRLSVAPGYEQTWAKVFVVISDITERKQAEAALSQSEERFRLMAWATQDAIWDWDLKTNQILWGEGLQKIFHYSADTTQATPEWRIDHIHPQDRAKVKRVIDQALEDGMEFWSKEYRFRRVDGTHADIMDRGYILRDDAGKPNRMIGSMMDITERKYMESTLLQSNEQMGHFVNELQQRNQQIALLNEMSHLLQASQSSQEAYETIADMANQLFPQTAGALYLLNASRDQVSAVASWGEISFAGQIFAPSVCRALRHSPTRPLPLNEDEPWACCMYSAQPPAATYCLPIHMQKEIIGIFHLQSASKENLTEMKRQLVSTVIEQSEMALFNLKLREALLEQSIHDSLTGLYNRRYMEEALKQQLSRVTRQLHPLCVIMIDIDHFKGFNDTHGHAAGDAVMRALGKFLIGNVRGGDIACRYGGEEFILIMPDTSLEAAHQRAEFLKQGVKRLHVQDAGQSFEGITLSLGVAVYPQHGRTMETILRAADVALYRAKQEGRDRVVTAE